MIPRQERGPTIPHDLAHAAVEQALGLGSGFWSVVERGGMFENFELLERGRNKRAGLKVLRRPCEATLGAEMAVSWAHRVWSGQRQQGRGLGAPPIDGVALATAIAALDEARARWDPLADGEALIWEWKPRL